jgi:predicted nucleotidyltransferase
MDGRFAVTREEAIRILHEALPGLKERFGILDLALFGSVARNEAGPDSDVDLLVTLGPDGDLFDLINLGFALEERLGVKVDLTTPKALKPLTRPSIARDLIQVA